MDSTSVYVTSSSHIAFQDKHDFEAPYEEDLGGIWYTISGEELGPAAITPIWSCEGEGAKPEMRDFLSEHQIIRNNCIRVYEFGALETASDAA
jgi:hypothetical protein